MIKIYERRSKGSVVLLVDGHAEAGPHGADIVCAAVSAIVQTALLGLRAIAEQHPDHVRIDASSDTPSLET